MFPGAKVVMYGNPVNDRLVVLDVITHGELTRMGHDMIETFELPQREGKPRKSGLTTMIDFGPD